VYPFKSSDSIEALVQAAGGLTDNASLNDVSLVVVRHDTDGVKQRVNINRADAWLLQALPGVGDTLANRIVDYREQNGDFANTSELVRVSGIGESLFERIKDLVTVSE
jgi:competence protein ComEA